MIVSYTTFVNWSEEQIQERTHLETAVSSRNDSGPRQQRQLDAFNQNYKQKTGCDFTSRTPVTFTS